MLKFNKKNYAISYRFRDNIAYFSKTIKVVTSSRDSDHAPFRDNLSSEGWYLLQSTATAEQLVERWVSYFKRELLGKGSSTNDFWRQKLQSLGYKFRWFKVLRDHSRSSAT